MIFLGSYRLRVIGKNELPKDPVPPVIRIVESLNMSDSQMAIMSGQLPVWPSVAPTEPRLYHFENANGACTVGIRLCARDS